ncbi:ATP-grasp domain-containing protein [Nocardioides sp.]|uniref:ATP-grasp domain-containing protein n=1 Tax=Nocardioides sp. TaxID=35761 RepID=UPI003D109DE6
MSDKVLLVTFGDMPDGEPAHEVLDAAFAARGVDAPWVVWDDPAVDWNDGLVVVRSTWDYDFRLEEFLAWSRSVPRLLNGAAVFAWNTDKSYLTQLVEAGLPVVPTTVATAATVADAVAAYDRAVVKPTVGAGGRGVQIVEPGSRPELEGLEPWIVQPLLGSVHTEGETSVFVFGGQAISQYLKRPAPGSILVHEHLGGTSHGVPLDAEATDLAIRAVEGASDLLERHLPYARVDMMRLDDERLVVSELELVEPGLYLDVNADNAAPFVDMVLTHL